MSNESKNQNSFDSYSAFKENVDTLVQNSNYKDLFLLLDDHNCQSLFRKYPDDILYYLVDILSSDQPDGKIIEYSEKLASVLVASAKASELYIFIPEQISLCRSLSIYKFLLKLLKLCFQKNGYSFSTMDLIVDSMKNYLSEIESSSGHQEHPYECEDILKSYGITLEWIKDLVNHLKSAHYKCKPGEQNIKTIMIELLLHMFGKSLNVKNFENPVNLELYMNLGKTVLYIEQNLIVLLKYLDPKFYREDIFSCISLQRDNFSNLGVEIGYINFFYTLFCKLEMDFLKVYHPLFILLHYLKIGSILLSTSLDEPSFELVLSVIEYFFRNTKVIIEEDSIDFWALYEFFERLSHYFLICNQKELKVKAHNLLKQYFDLFSDKAKYLLFINVLNSNICSFMRCIIIQIIKEHIVKLFNNSNNQITAFEHCNYSIVFRKMCTLKFQNHSELFEYSDEIISILNCILYLTIRDSSNITGIREFVSKECESGFFKNLSEIISLGKDYWQQQLNSPQENSDIDSQLHKNHECNQALNCIGIIEMILMQINEYC